jgi:hypothetical protein
LPADVLVDFWLAINKRKAAEINALNHAGALLVSIKTADEKSTKLEFGKWLPFDLGDKSTLSISKVIAAELIRLRDTGELPQAMLRDLYTNKLIALG